MYDIGVLAPLGWLIFAVGIGVIVISEVRSKNQVRSPTRRISGILSGLFFCLLACVVIIPGIQGGTQKALAIAAIVCGALSWYLGLHARKVDRMARQR